MCTYAGPAPERDLHAYDDVYHRVGLAELRMLICLCPRESAVEASSGALCQP